MNSNEIKDLITKAQSGDSDAFGELYKETAKSVYYTCLKLTGRSDVAQDIMQDSYIYALERIGELKNPESFKAWVCRIAINKCNAFFNSEKGYTELDESTLEDEDFLSDDSLFEQDKRQILQNIIDNELTVVQRQTIILYYYNGLEISEIAKIMGCPESTVMSRLRLARQKIREGVVNYEQSEGIRLHSVAPLLFFNRFFELDVQATELPSSVAKFKFERPGGKNAPSAHGGKTMASAIKTKIIIGAISAAVVAGGVITAVVVSSNKDSDKDSSSSSSIIVGSQDSSSEAVTPDYNSSNASGAISFEGITAGSYITFGSYEQDNNTSNGKEAIEWEVLDIKDGKALLVSRYCLDCQPYNIASAGSTWEDCTLRKWLDETFLVEAFSAQEQALIVPTTHTSSADEVTYPGDGEVVIIPHTIETTDKVFVLSKEEYNTYYTYDKDNYEATACAPTEYAIANKAYVADYFGVSYAMYWLRDSHSVGAAFTTIRGVDETYKSQNHSLTAVRHAIWVAVE